MKRIFAALALLSVVFCFKSPAKSISVVVKDEGGRVYLSKTYDMQKLGLFDRLSGLGYDGLLTKNMVDGLDIFEGLNVLSSGFGDDVRSAVSAAEIEPQNATVSFYPNASKKFCIFRRAVGQGCR